MAKDLIARAKNGTGKTASFVIPILQLINTNPKDKKLLNYLQALILVPTRELALQTSFTVKEIGKYLNVQCMVSTGGTDLKEDILRLKNGDTPVHIVVGTPGRVYDLANKKVLNLENCRILVLDEADKLLGQDFKKIIEKIISFLPKKKTNYAFFSYISFRC